MALGTRRFAWGPIAALLVCLFALSAFSERSNAAIKLNKKQTVRLTKLAANSGAGKGFGIRVSKKGKVSVAPFFYKAPATALAVRSSVSAKWRLLVVSMDGRYDQRMTFLYKRAGGRQKLVWAASRGEEAAEVCRRRQPRSTIVFDLGLTSSSWGKGCKFKRDRLALTRKMRPAELASVREAVEWTYNDEGRMVPGPVQPKVSDVFVSECRFNPDGLNPPFGEVSRQNPRWAVVRISCAVAYDGFGEVMDTVDLLVYRPKKTGRFTRSPGLTIPAWSQRVGKCSRNRKWPVPAAVRVALEFCSPYPFELYRILL